MRFHGRTRGTWSERNPYKKKRKKKKRKYKKKLKKKREVCATTHKRDTRPGLAISRRFRLSPPPPMYIHGMLALAILTRFDHPPSLRMVYMLALPSHLSLRRPGEQIVVDLPLSYS